MRGRGKKDTVFVADEVTRIALATMSHAALEDLVWDFAGGFYGEANTAGIAYAIRERAKIVVLHRKDRNPYPYAERIHAKLEAKRRALEEGKVT